MDTVVKNILEDEEEPNRGLFLFGKDLSQIPCFRESFLYGIGSGIGIGLAAFIKTSKPLRSQHIGFGGFVMTTLGYWSYCRYAWSKQRFDAMLMQEALKDKLLKEGTILEQQLEAKGIIGKV